jgi:dTDP-4-amino-4,6-dideoxygalactose transaminase
MIFHFLRESHGICDIYTPSLAFASPAWAAKHFGHNLNFVDVDKNLLFDCRDYKQKRSKLQSNNKIVLMPILYGGVSSVPNWDVFGDEIVVVDSAHSITPTIESDFTFFSFHPYKPVCTSDGGVTENSNTKMNKLKMVKLYPLLHKTKYFSQNIPLKNTEKLYNCYCNLPLHGGLSDGDLDLILQVINE